MTTAHIHPFMNFIVDSIRKKLLKKVNTGWKMFLMMMKIAPVDEGVSNFVSNVGDQITEANIQSYF